ncbi:hypothetical protein H2200_013342 [Cladophialophora chaetospira]|uniref:Capsule polysaccharide biosynthesis protein n=1 Tax=Cladophialophora chaetospira TaxID=386627 RepID=A0AA38WW51_9EURO|nr:hypothetical protein H2200_013342 [Cladophialophora chaetospira]
MPSLPALSTFASWRTIALLFALLNLKSLPLAWHFRLFYRMYRTWYSRARVDRALQGYRSRAQSSSSSVHPIFQSETISLRSPILETDYNLHKSNSTYFADLDESRTAVVTKLLVPGFRQGNINLEREGHRGRLSVMLGSVHTSFHREIRPYELYEVRSRVLGWDKKWVVIGSFFVRPGNKETLLASALSKYVIKKGRFTVPPERCFITAGWMPERPESVDPSSEEASIAPTPQEGLVAAIPSSLGSTTEGLVEKLEKATATETEAATSGSSSGEWDWHRIEQERLRGLQIAAGWLALDQELKDEFLRI